MAGFEFSEEESLAISKLAVADEWDIEVLERRIRHAILDGCSFGRAVARVLVQAERPDDKPAVVETKSLIALVEEKRAAAAARLAKGRVKG